MFRFRSIEGGKDTAGSADQVPVVSLSASRKLAISMLTNLFADMANANICRDSALSVDGDTVFMQLKKGPNYLASMSLAYTEGVWTFKYRGASASNRDLGVVMKEASKWIAAFERIDIRKLPVPDKMQSKLVIV